MAKYTAREIKTWEVARGPDYRPARPLNYQLDGLKRRLKLAWAVFIGRYDALDWEDDDV
jgi:hypothetical protein